MASNSGERGTQLLSESRLRGALPEGFQTTLVESDRLRELSKADTGLLTDVVEDYDGNTLTERDIIRAEAQAVLTSFQTPERTLELPGLGIEFARLQQFAAYYKADNDTPSGTIKDEKRANTDDIIFTQATPEVFEEISGNAQDTFEVGTVTSGTTVDIIGDSGLPETNPTNGTSLQLDSDEMLYFTGDFIDVSDGQSPLTKIQWADIDGEDYGPDNGYFSNRLAGTHLFTGQGAWVKSTVDLDAKAYVDGTAELVPVAFYMAPGSKAPNLV